MCFLRFEIILHKFENLDNEQDGQNTCTNYELFQCIILINNPCNRDFHQSNWDHTNIFNLWENKWKSHINNIQRVMLYNPIMKGAL